MPFNDGAKGEKRIYAFTSENLLKFKVNLDSQEKHKLKKSMNH